MTLTITFNDGTSNVIFGADVDGIEDFIQRIPAEKVATVTDWKFS